VRENSFLGNPVEPNTGEFSPEGASELSPALHSLRKKSVLYLILGGAAVHRCSKCIVLNPALAAEGTALAHGRLSPLAVQRWEKWEN
jgi:hypothetical protein